MFITRSTKWDSRTSVLPIVFLFFCLNLCFSQGAHVRTSTNFLNPTNATTIAATFAGNSTNGNLIVVHVSYSGQTISVTGMADSKGNAYTRINGPTNWNGTNFRSELWYAFNIIGGAGAITVTTTLSAAPVNTGGLKFSQLYISEFSGIRTTNPLDIKSVNAATAGGAGPFNSGSASMNYSNELVYGAAIGGTMGVINVGGGFTSISTANSNLVEFRNVAAAASTNSVFTGTSGGTFVADMAAFITNGSVLPVTLVSFDAEQEGGVVKLKWVTASEKNNDYFEVQRSADAQEWTVIGEVPGAGTSTAVNHYAAEDPSPQTGVNYYRLRQVDFDGRSEYSTIRMVDMTRAESTMIRFYPNPTKEWLHIEASQEALNNLTVFNLLSVNVNDKISVAQRESGISLNVSGLPAGMYIARIGNAAVRFYREP